ncbi:MAG: hypothetical protein M1453_02750 [Acidobacteria bacterium]|nr:hypothetical protein [Acidobacteriota bacterium]MCL5286899.1 hypothetical protein [Acidobacteriota bacterium]
MQAYEKLRPLLEEYNRLSDEWRELEPWQAAQNTAWNFRHRVLNERRKELQSQILQLTQSDRRLVN